MNRRRALALPLLISGCSTPDHLRIAQAQLPVLHRQYNERKFEQIWFQATTDFQNNYTRERFVALLNSARSQLGVVVRTEMQGWQAIYQGSGVQVNLTQKTMFALSDGVETIGYRVESGTAFLTAYLVNSPALAGNDAYPYAQADRNRLAASGSGACCLQRPVGYGRLQVFI